MAARAIWKGYLRFGELVCPVALHAAASTSDRVSFHVVNRKTGHRVRRVYVDAETEKPVEREDQVRGYETESGKTVILEPDEIADLIPESDRVLHLEGFVPCSEVDTLFLDRPYYLTPGEESAETAFAVVRDGLAKKKVAAVVQTVLFRRVRSLMIRAVDNALLAHTLEYDHEVRDAGAALDDVDAPKLDKEMLDLAEHIIRGKRGKFDPSKFEDRYDQALAELVKAKIAGKPLPVAEEPEPTERGELLEALRASASAKRASAGKSGSRRATAKKPSTAKKKAAGSRRKAS
jgi:DNA end-binding protein Ku